MVNNHHGYIIMVKNGQSWLLHVMNGYLVGGLEHDFFDFPYVGNIIIINPN